MNFEIRNEKECPSDWNNNLINSPMGNVYNTVEYSNYGKDILNWQPSFFSIISSTGELLSQTVLFKIPSSLKKKIFFRVKNTIRWRYGPVIFSKEHDIIAHTFLEHLFTLEKNFDGSFHPFFIGTLDNFRLKKEKRSTYIIDLQNTKDSIIKKFDKKSVLNNIRRAQERGVEIHEIDNDSISQYTKLLNEYRLSMKITTYSDREIFELWKLLKPVGFKGFIASKDGKNIGGITFSTFNGYLNEWGIARSEKDTKEKLYAQDLLKWKVIEWGIQNNQKYFDFSGFNPTPQTKKEEGILRYKKKWGGHQKDFWHLRK